VAAGEEFFMQIARTSEGSMPPVHPQFYKRFGGLPQQEMSY
jgi:phenylacetic acid degradation operon negative regulatory protein